MSSPDPVDCRGVTNAGKPSVGDAPTKPPFSVVGVGASAGGLEAFTRLLENLPPHPGVALVLVQHLDPSRESLLAGILSKATPLPVSEARDGMQVDQNAIYVIPPNCYLGITGGRLLLTPRSDTPGPIMPIDYFFRSLANDLGSRAVGVILSGGGSDGTLGLEAIKAAGGIAFAQTEATARQFSMPQSAVASGCVDLVLPPEGIALELVRIGTHPYITAPQSSPDPDEQSPALDDNLARLFALLREQNGVDFTHYKRNTILRRIQRQMALNEVSDLGEFVGLVSENPAKASAVFQDILIRVTSFFREPGAFETLQKTAFPALTRDRPADAPIRIWVPGCSTGEEAYSIAIALLEFLGDRAENTSIKILATDINEEVLARARRGIYLENIAADVSPERLRRFFHRSDGSYRINKSIRDLCVFARHNVFSDPPFARIDLISCRNVLIYLDATLQRRAVPIFHYALKPGGLLLLGPSESIGTFTDLFSPVDRDRGLYLRSLLSHRSPAQFFDHPRATDRPEIRPTAARLDEPTSLLDIQREADQIQLKHAPAGVLIDENLNVLQFRGDTSPYLQHAPGAASLELPRMAREGLLTSLREAVQSARSQNIRIRREDIRYLVEDQLRSVTLQVIPLRSGPAPLRCFLVLFENQIPPVRPASSTAPPDSGLPASSSDAGDDRLPQLQQQLHSAREHLQSVTEEYEATNEELQSANEEILASNEELQSANEELQTTKEEIQSANEELETVNEELQHRNRDLSRVNDDLLNLLAGIHIPIVMVNRDLRIRRFTAEAGQMFQLTAPDLGRPLREVRGDLDLGDLERIVAQVIDSLTPAERELQDRSGRWHSVRVRAYETEDNKIDGAVITVINIDAIKHSAQQLQESRDFVSRILDTVRESLVVFDQELRIQSANRSFLHAFRLLPDQVLNRPLLEVWGADANAERMQGLLDGVRAGAPQVQELELEHSFRGIDQRILHLHALPLALQAPARPLFLLAIEDVTDRRRVEQARHDLEVRMFHSQKLESLGVLAGGIAHDLNNILTPILGYSDLLCELLATDSPAVPILQLMEKHTRQAAELVREILNYSGKGKFVVEPVDLSRLVQEMSGLLGAVISKKAERRYELAADLPAVSVDTTQIRQVIMNLVSNASEALEDGSGRLTIQTGLFQAEAGGLQAPQSGQDLPAGAYAFIEVSDTGCGMSPETQGKMFDPFFSTKFTGRGLGLAAVLGIVEGHHGAIQVKSERGRGTTIRVLLPVAERPAASPVAEAPLAGDWHGSGTVLVIDDEEGVRTATTLILERLGFEVRQACDGIEGLDVYRQHQPQIVAVLLDLTMPRLGGLETLVRLRQLSPQVPVILMSGYTAEQEVSARHSELGIAGYLQKPFSRKDLIAVFRRAL